MPGSTSTVEPRSRRSANACTLLRVGSTQRAPSDGRERWLVAPALLAALLALFAAPRAARAFSEPRSYYDDPAFGGGGGRWFTSSPAEGYGCSVCHTGGGSSKLSITGLPTSGYAPGMSYEVVLAWPEFAARARMLRDLPDVEDPSMGLVAELVSESGLGAGSIDILDPKAALPADLCTVPPGTRAAQLYAVHPGEPTAERALRCEATALGQRCLVAVLACGAEQLRFRWTAPVDPVGPVWFSAGFVTTDAISGTPQGDAVTEVARPMLPASSSAERYESTLQGGCSIARAPRATLATGRDASLPRTASWLLGGGLLLLRARRARARRKELG